MDGLVERSAQLRIWCNACANNSKQAQPGRLGACFNKAHQALLAVNKGLVEVEHVVLEITVSIGWAGLRLFLAT